MELGARSQVGRADLPDIVVVPSTGSTNDEVMELGRGEAPQGTCVAAHAQTAGRGRRGSTWASPAGGLYLSVLLRPKVSMQHLMGLSAVCGMGVLDALRELGAARALLKWPNDVVVPAEDDPSCLRKLGGLLIEAGTGDAGVFAVCGVGINLGSVAMDQFDALALEPATLADATGEGRDQPGFDELAAAIRDHVAWRCDAWAHEVAAGHAAAGPLSPVLSDYMDCLALLGHAVAAVRPDGVELARGMFRGLDVWDRVTVVDAFGREHEFAAEQASLVALPEVDTAR